MFCHSTRDELGEENADEGWVRGALAVCELYANVDAMRFEVILLSLATGRTGIGDCRRRTLAAAALAPHHVRRETAGLARTFRLY